MSQNQENQKELAPRQSRPEVLNFSQLSESRLSFDQSLTSRNQVPALSHSKSFESEILMHDGSGVNSRQDSSEIEPDSPREKSVGHGNIKKSEPESHQTAEIDEATVTTPTRLADPNPQITPQISKEDSLSDQLATDPNRLSQHSGPVVQHISQVTGSTNTMPRDSKTLQSNQMQDMMHYTDSEMTTQTDPNQISKRELPSEINNFSKPRLQIFSQPSGSEMTLQMDPNKVSNNRLQRFMQPETLGTIPTLGSSTSQSGVPSGSGVNTAGSAVNEKKSFFRSRLKKISLARPARPVGVPRFNKGDDFIVGIDFNSKAQKKKLKQQVSINLKQSIKLGDLTGSATTNATEPLRLSSSISQPENGLLNLKEPAALSDPHKNSRRHEPKLKKIDEIDSEFRKFVQSQTEFGTISKSQRVTPEPLSKSEYVDVGTLSDEDIQRLIKEKMRVLDIYNVFVIKKAEDSTGFR